MTTQRISIFQRPTWVAVFALTAAIAWGWAFPLIKVGFGAFGITADMTGTDWIVPSALRLAQSLSCSTFWFVTTCSPRVPLCPTSSISCVSNFWACAITAQATSNNSVENLFILSIIL